MKWCNTIMQIGFVLVLFISCKNEEIISKKSPTVKWENPTDIYYGTLLSSTQLNATADVEGKFEYTPALGTKLNVGNAQILKTLFTPNDFALNDTVSKTVQINVLSKRIPIITWENPADIGSETLISATQLNATADVPGTFEYTPTLGTKLNVGDNQLLCVKFIPTDTVTNDTVSKTVKINVLDASFKVGIKNSYIDVVDIGNIKVYPIQQGNHSYGSYTIDIDNDGINDIKFKCSSYASMSGPEKEVLLEITNKAFQASTVTIIDTTYTYSRTQDITVGGQVYKQIYLYYINSISKGIPADATISSINTSSYPKVNMCGDTLTHAESWSNDLLTLASSVELAVQGSGTTIYSIKRGNWLGQDMKYILIKKSSGDTCRYGWIKLGVSKYDEVHIYEYALQK